MVTLEVMVKLMVTLMMTSMVVVSILGDNGDNGSDLEFRGEMMVVGRSW